MKVTHTCFKYSTVQNKKQSRTDSNLYYQSMPVLQNCVETDAFCPAVSTKPATACKTKAAMEFTPAFKGILGSFFSKDTVLTEKEVKARIKKLKMKQSEVLEFTATGKQGEYSNNRLEKLIDLHKNTKAWGQTARYFNKCLKKNETRTTFNGALCNAITELFDKGLPYYIVDSVLHNAWNKNQKKYNIKILQHAIESAKELKYNTPVLIKLATNSKGKFNPEIFNLCIKAVKENYFTDVHFAELVKDCGSETNQGLNINLLKKAMELKEFGLEFRYIQHIIILCQNDDTPIDKDLLDSLTENIPQSLTNMKEIGQFIATRLNASMEQYTTQKAIDRKAYNFFNKLYAKYNDIELRQSILNITQKYGRSRAMYQNSIEKFIFDISDYISPTAIDEITDYAYNYEAYPKLTEAFKLIPEQEKSQIKDVLRYCSINNYYSENPSGEVLDIFIKQYPKYKDKFSAAYTAKTINKLIKSDGYSARLNLATTKNLQFLINITDEKKQDFYTKLMKQVEPNLSTVKLFEKAKYIDKLLDLGIDPNKLLRNARWHEGIFANQMTIEDLEQYIKDTQNLIKQNVTPEYLLTYLDKDDEADKAVALDIRNEAVKRRNTLASAGEELSYKDIDDVFLQNYSHVSQTVRVIGKDALLYSFVDKLDNVENYIETIGEYCRPCYKHFEDLLKITNPTETEYYQNRQDYIKKLKQELKTAENESGKSALISQLNTATKEVNNLVQNAIKDNKDKIEAAMIFSAIMEAEDNIEAEMENNADLAEPSTENTPYIGDIIHMMNPKTEEEKKAYYEKLNSMIFTAMEIEPPSEETIKRLSFKDSKYLPKLFNTDSDFKENFEQIVELLEENPDKSTLEIFINLPQNIETKRQFKKLGLNYDKWVKYNPESKVTVNIKTDIEKQKQSAIRNLEADLNDELFKKLPESETKKLFKALEQEGFQVLEKDEALYEGDGFLNGTKKVLKLYKNNEPVEFKDLAKIIKIIKTEINNNEFWNTKNKDESINTAKDTIKNHILKLRYNEVKTARDNKSDKEINLVIQKADMNDISHALFLGNDASCCTAIGTGFNMWSAPTYIMNKLISGIEVKDGSNYAGNTMMYLAMINDKPALVLDNIELKSKYQYNDKIRDAIFEYAKMITKELGNADMPIYLGPNRHKVNLDEYPIEYENFSIIGSTGEDEIYLDFDADAHTINEDSDNDFGCELYQIN